MLAQQAKGCVIWWQVYNEINGAKGGYVKNLVEKLIENEN